MALFNDILRGLDPGGAERADQRAEVHQRGIESSQTAELLQTYRAIDGSTSQGAQQKAEILSQIRQGPSFQRFQATTESSARSLVNKKTSFDKLGKVTRLKSSGDGVFTQEQNAALDTEIDTLFADSGLMDANPNAATNEQTLQLSSFFEDSYTSFKKTSKKSLGSQEETKAFVEGLEKQADNLGIPRTAANALIGNLYAEKTAERGFFTDDVLPVGSTASDFLTDAPVGKKRTGKATDPNELEAFENFVQVGTEAFPNDTTPKPRAAVGITELNDQQTMQEIEQAAPKGMDVQQIAQLDPEGFKQMLAALRRGKTPSGKPFTMKDALKLMGNL